MLAVRVVWRANRGTGELHTDTRERERKVLLDIDIGYEEDY